ncbi:MAG TPA: hypothetical protein VF263_01805, partial [Longimicrobiaceae bacterium]
MRTFAPPEKAPAPRAAAAPRPVLGSPRPFGPAAPTAAVPQGRGHSFGEVAVQRKGTGVIQRGVLDTIRGWFGKKKDQQPLLRPRSQSYQQHVFYGSHDTEEVRANNQRHADAASSSALPEHASTALSVGSAGVSAVGKTADTLKLLHLAGSMSGSAALGVAGPAATALGGVVDAGVNIGDLAAGGRQGADTADTGSELVSNLGKATANASLATFKGAQLAGHPLSSAATATLGHVAAPAAMVSGAADILGGAFGAHRAGKRQAALEAHASNRDNLLTGGMAEFAAEQQKTKKNANKARIAKGALGLGGGIALAAAGLSNPIGWGLLGAAGLVGGGIAAYRKYRQYQQGKRILDDHNYRARLGLGGVDPQRLDEIRNMSGPKRWWHTMKLHDSVRGHVANQLVE